MSVVVANFAQLVGAAPDPVIGAARVGAAEPSTAGDMPAIVVGLTIDNRRTSGVGRVIRSGDFGGARRDDILGDAYRALLSATLWGGALADVTALSERLQQRLLPRSPLMRQLGFAALYPAGLLP